MFGFLQYSFVDGFFKWVFDSLEALNGFLRQVVVSRRDEGIRRWIRVFTQSRWDALLGNWEAVWSSWSVWSYLFL